MALVEHGFSALKRTFALLKVRKDSVFPLLLISKALVTDLKKRPYFYEHATGKIMAMDGSSISNN
jgi:hypothetical protein